MATLAELPPERLAFCRGATEAAAMIFRHLAVTVAAAGESAATWAVNPTEHPAVRDACLASGGARVHWLEVNADGVVTPAAVGRALAAGARVIVVMAANHETGVIQPWPEIARVTREAGATLVCDATQWLGKLPAGGLGAADWGFGSAHKFGGPKGVGLFWMPVGLDRLAAPAVDGSGEGIHRDGTADFPGIAAMGTAWLHAEEKEVFLESERVRMRAGFERDLVAAVPGTRVVGAGVDRLWNTVLALMPEAESSRWVTRLDRRGFEVASGAACTTNKNGPSPGLTAIGLTADEARRVVRVSAGAATTAADWAALAAAFAAVAPEVKPAPGVIKI